MSAKSQIGRKPNVSFRCEECDALVVKYIRPSHPRERFCSRHCSMVAAMRDPQRAASVRLVGEANAMWQGDAVSVEGGRKRARRMYKAGPCTKCGDPKSERHHINGDTANNTPENVELLCRKCHMTEDGRLEASRERMRPLAAKRWAR